MPSVTILRRLKSIVAHCFYRRSSLACGSLSRQLWLLLSVQTVLFAMIALTVSVYYLQRGILNGYEQTAVITVNGLATEISTQSTYAGRLFRVLAELRAAERLANSAEIGVERPIIPYHRSGDIKAAPFSNQIEEILQDAGPASTLRIYRRDSNGISQETVAPPDNPYLDQPENQRIHRDMLDRLLALPAGDWAAEIVTYSKPPARHIVPPRSILHASTISFIYVAAVDPDQHGNDAGLNRHEADVDRIAVVARPLSNLLATIPACPLASCSILFRTDSGFAAWQDGSRWTEDTGPSARHALASGIPVATDESHVHATAEIPTIPGAYIVLTADRATLNSGFADYRNTLILLTLVAFSLITVFGHRYLRSRLVEPVESLEKAFHQLESGNFDIRLEPSGNNEISRLSNAFNQMAIQLERITDELVDSQQRHRMLINNNVVAMLVVTENDRRIIFANYSACRLYKFQDSQPVGATLDHYTTEGRAKSDVERAIEGPHRTMHTIETGQVKHIEMTAAPVTMTDDPFVLLMLRDVSHEVDLEREMKIVRHSLEKSLTDRTDHLEKALAQAQKVKEQQAEHQAMLAHELKNPLAVIISASEWVLRQPEISQASFRRVNRSLSSAKRIEVLLGTALETARFETGRLQPVIEPVDLAQAIARVVKQHSKIDRSHHYEITVSQENWLVDIDPRLFEHVLANLLSNSAKYSHPESQIDVVLTRSPDIGRDIIVKVRDSGIGIPADEVDKIFDKFFRATNTGSVLGDGVGLFFCRSMIELFGGRLEVDSREGHGTVMSIVLPASTAMEAGGGDALPIVPQIEVVA